MKRTVWFSIGLALLSAATFALGDDRITVNAHGSKLNGIGPIMQLWVNGSKQGEVHVDVSTPTDYGFSANLPVSGRISLDVVFVNDAYQPPQDRNLFLNSVLVRGQLFLPTDAGVVLDRGSGSAAFDGRNVIPGQLGVYWNGATRFSMTLAEDAGGNCVYPVYSGGTLRIGKESTINGHDISGRGNAIDPDTGRVNDAELDTRFFNPDSFPSFSGGGNYRGNGNGLIPGSRYDSVVLTGGAVPNGDYQIDTLAIDGDVTFTGGAIYVKSMTISEEETVNFSAATLFHVGIGVSIGKEVRLSASGTPWAQFYLYGSADWRADKELRMDGLVLGAGEGANITVGKDSRITGALITAGDITLDKEIDLTYNATVQAALPSAGGCGGNPPAPVAPARFNCVENGADGADGHLYTKLAGAAFSFDVVALKDNGAVETGYAAEANQSVSVQLGYATDTACTGWVEASPAVSQILSFTSADRGRKTLAATVANAYSNLRCRVVDVGRMPERVSCSSDSFAVRPMDFNVTSSANGAGTVKAGAGFSLSAASGTAGYNGTPKLDAGKVSAHSGAVATGLLAGNFSAADSNTGTATGSAFTYSEVGLFTLSAQGVYDDSFVAVDVAAGDCSADFSNTTSPAGQYGCKFGNTATTSGFGRFIPDHFDVSLNAPVFAPGCATFTYIGQPIKYATRPVATVSAKNAAAVTTRNYTASYWRIDPNHASYGIAPSYSEASQPLTVLNSSAPVAADNGNGTGTLSFADTGSNILAVTRNSPLPPLNAEIALSFNLRDTDGVTAVGNPVRFGTASAGNGIAFSGGNKEMRWGRLVLQNANGSELIPLPVPLFSEYFNGNSFVKNSADNCTSVNLASQLWLSNPVTAAGVAQAGNTTMTLAPAGTTQASLLHATLAAGDAGLSFSAPGSGNTGYIDINGQFSASPWLLFDWDGNGSQDNSPSARATFGIYKGNSKQIYWREVY